MKRQRRRWRPIAASSSRSPAGSMSCAHFVPMTGFLAIRRSRPYQPAKADRFQTDLYPDKLGYLTPFRGSRIPAGASACRSGMRPRQSRRSAFVRTFREEVMRETAARWRSAPRPHQHDLLRTEPRSDRGRSTGRRFASPDCNHRDGAAYIWRWRTTSGPLCCASCASTTAADGPDARRHRSRGETIARHGFAISAGEWHDDIHAVGVALRLNEEPVLTRLIAAHRHSASRKTGCATILDLASWRW